MNNLYTLLFLSSLTVSSAALASPASDALLAGYKAGGVTHLDAAKAKADWTKEGKGEDGEAVSCSSCHGTDLAKPGKHCKTHKTIEPLSPRVNPERFTDEMKIEKWFKRNCNGTWGRECSAQEKADFLTFLLAQ